MDRKLSASSKSSLRSATKHRPQQRRKQYAAQAHNQELDSRAAIARELEQRWQEAPAQAASTSSPARHSSSSSLLASKQQHQQQQQQQRPPNRHRLASNWLGDVGERQSQHDEEVEIEAQDRCNASELSVQEQVLHLVEELEQEAPPIEQVYLSSGCCGATKELEPAMRHVPLTRSLFHLFNLLAIALAFGLFGLGLWFRIDPKVYELHKHIETQNFTIAGWIMLFAGFLACLLGVAGAVAAGREFKRLLLAYCIIMTVFILVLAATLILLTVHGLGASLGQFMRKEIYEQIRRRAMQTEVAGPDEHATQFLDFLQVKLRCCGAVDFRDYQKLGMVLPATCYTIPDNYIKAPGCADAIRRLFDLRAGLASGFTLACLLAQMAACTCALLLLCTFHNYQSRLRQTRSSSSEPQRPPIQSI